MSEYLIEKPNETDVPHTTILPNVYKVIENAERRDASPPVTIGSVVTINFIDEFDNETIQIVERLDSPHLRGSIRQVITSLPLGEMILGKKVGEEITYTGPGNRPIRIKIVAVE